MKLSSCWSEIPNDTYILHSQFQIVHSLLSQILCSSYVSWLVNTGLRRYWYLFFQELNMIPRSITPWWYVYLRRACIWKSSEVFLWNLWISAALHWRTISLDAEKYYFFVYIWRSLVLLPQAVVCIQLYHSKISIKSIYYKIHCQDLVWCFSWSEQREGINVHVAYNHEHMIHGYQRSVNRLGCLSFWEGDKLEAWLIIIDLQQGVYSLSASLVLQWFSALLVISSKWYLRQDCNWNFWMGYM